VIRFGSRSEAKREEREDQRADFSHLPLQEEVAPAPVAPAPAAAQYSDELSLAPAPPAPEPVTGGRELFIRHARKDGRLVAVLRAVDHGASCTVEAEVYPHGSTQLTRPGPYTFPDAHQASAFVTEAVAALMYLGCDIQAQ
jgi:hypothetical protein